MFDVSAGQREEEAIAREALRQLPAEQGEVIVMKLWGGLQFDQIGATLGININTAASRYRYGLEKLRVLLGEESVR